MIKRIALINPNFLLREKFNFDITYPLGLAYIASVLEKNNFAVSIIDANALNISQGRLIKNLLDIKPDLVGISCNFSPLHNPTLQIAGLVKKHLNIPIIVGGNHACALKNFFIDNKNIDFVIKGEAEYTFLNLVLALNGDKDLHNVDGILFKRQEKKIETKNAELIIMENLPLPAFHLLPMNLYDRYSVMTSRGCPFNCSYCASKVIFGRSVRMRSVESVVSEIKYLMDNYGKKVVWFCDDTFTADEDYVLDLCNLLKNRKLDISWRCHTHVAKISKRMLQIMRESGCFCIVFGIESGSQKILKKMHKAINREQAMNAIKETRQAGIDAAAFFMVGMPGEDMESVMDSYRLIHQCHPTSVSFCITLPLPETGLFNELLEQKIISINELKWDYFFARVPGHREEEYYAASLASKWCNLSADELIQTCILGDKIPGMHNKFNELKIKRILKN